MSAIPRRKSLPFSDDFMPFYADFIPIVDINWRMPGQSMPKFGINWHKILILCRFMPKLADNFCRYAYDGHKLAYPFSRLCPQLA